MYKVEHFSFSNATKFRIRNACNINIAGQMFLTHFVRLRLPKQMVKIECRFCERTHTDRERERERIGMYVCTSVYLFPPKNADAASFVFVTQAVAVTIAIAMAAVRHNVVG